MKFEWDPQKAESNLRKHGASFEEAMTVFKDALAFIFDDVEHSETEHREIIIGAQQNCPCMLCGKSSGYHPNFQRPPRNKR